LLLARRFGHAGTRESLCGKDQESACWCGMKNSYRTAQSEGA
jgi:hypothetical protein